MQRAAGGLEEGLGCRGGGGAGGNEEGAALEWEGKGILPSCTYWK